MSPNKRSLGLLVRSLVFCAGLAVMLAAADFVFTPTVGTLDGWAASRAIPGQVDVIALGSSRTYCTVLPMEMWRTRGITALDVTSAIQIVPVTTAYLEEILRTRQPKVVMVELYMVGKRSTFHSTTAHKGLDYMPMGTAKLRSIVQWVKPQAWFEFLMPLQIYHSRWSEVGASDFRLEKYSRFSYGRGAMYLADEAPLTVQTQGDVMTEDAYQEDAPYLREMAELCEQNGIKLILFTSPSPYRLAVVDRLLLERLRADLAAFPNVTYMDMNEVVGELGIDAHSDYKDDLHLNHRGAVKISRWLAELLAEQYAVPDRRGTDLDDGWDADLKAYDEAFVADW